MALNAHSRQMEGAPPRLNLGGNFPPPTPTAKSIVARREEFKRWLEAGRTNVFTVNTNLTPEGAKILIDGNPDNRSLIEEGKDSVAAYASAMERGEWVLNGETIIVSSDGYLNDGQHRCHAVIRSGVSIPVLIVFGVNRESRHTVDQGIKRTHGAVLTMHGKNSGNNLAASVRFVFNYWAGRSFRNAPSTTQLLEISNAHPGLSVAVNEVRVLANSYRLSLGVIGAAYYICSSAHPGNAVEFLDTAGKGLGIQREGHPAFRLRQAYQAHLGGKRLHPVTQAALFIKAFNAFSRGKSLRSLKWEAGEAFPIAGE